MITTVLHEWEQNIPLQNKELQALLEDVRKRTGENWQVTSKELIVKKRWFRKPITKTFYSVYFPVKGCLPWQIINMYGENGRMNLRFSEEVLAAYLMGLSNGAELHELK